MIQILQGDCLQLMRDIPANSVHMIFTDPPYGHKNNDGDLIANWEKALGHKPKNVIIQAQNRGYVVESIGNTEERGMDRVKECKHEKWVAVDGPGIAYCAECGKWISDICRQLQEAQEEVERLKLAEWQRAKEVEKYG